MIHNKSAADLPEAADPGKLQYKLYCQIQICQRADNI